MQPSDDNTVTSETKHDTPTVKTPKPKKAKAKASVKKSAAKAEKKSKGKTKVGKGAKNEGPAALKRYAPTYKRDVEHKTAGGNPSVHCGDTVAKKFLGKDLNEIYKIVAEATETPTAELKRKYGGLNLGMQRMNLGNKMRGVLNAK